MLYYGIDKQTVLAVDASPFGVAAVLGHRKYDSEQCNIIACRSRPLTPAEKNYSQLEREGVGDGVWCRKFYTVHFGTPV